MKCLAFRIFLLSIGCSTSLLGGDQVAVIVGFNGALDENLLQRAGGRATRTLASANAVAGSLPSGAVAALKRNPNVAYIEEDRIVSVTGKAANAGGQSTPWGVAKLWSSTPPPGTTKGGGVVVAVLDTGVDQDHPDLVGNLVTGYSFVNNNENTDDKNGHGTHVAGTVAALDNGIDVVGVAPEATILPVQVLGAGGSGTTSGVIAGIDWAVSNGADVISMSLGSSSASGAELTAVQEAVAAGSLVIAAAGNDGDGNGSNEDPVSYPGRYDVVVAVGSTTSSDKLSSFSTSGCWVDVSAPGSSILSTKKGGGTTTFSGTSMATPHVSGEAALIIAAYAAANPDNPDIQVAEVRERLEGSSIDLGGSSYDNGFGWGRLDAVKALLNQIRSDWTIAGGECDGTPPPPPPPTGTTADVESITLTTVSARRNRVDLLIDVNVDDLAGSGGNALSAAEVTVRLVEPNGTVRTASGLTDSSGVAKFRRSGAVSGTNTVTVTNIVKSGYAFDPNDADNVESIDL